MACANGSVRSLLALLLLLGLPCQALAVISHVADRLLPAASAVDSQASTAFTPGAGNLLVVTIKLYGTAPISAVVTDNVNAGAYTQAFVKPAAADAPNAVLQYYKNNVAAASTIVTINPNGASVSSMRVVISEFTGQETTSAVLDAATTTGTPAGGAAPSLTTSTPGVASTAVVAAMVWTNQVATATPGAGYTEMFAESGPYPRHTSMQRTITTSAAPVVVNWTTSVAVDGNIGVGIYRASTGVVIPPAVVLAFPSAEGFGKDSTGGRGGFAYNINSLSTATGSGGSCNAGGCGGSAPFSAGTVTFKDCFLDRFAKGARTCIFRVSGIIDFSGAQCETCWLGPGGFNGVTAPPLLTIAGQTAPGDGIILKAMELSFWNTNHIIVRHLRVRPGDVTPTTVSPGPPAQISSSFGAIEGYNVSNIILDHYSAGWAWDDTVGTVLGNNITFQWGIVSEGHGCPTCTDGSVSKVGTYDTRNMNVENTGASFLHNLWVGHFKRVPQLQGGRAQLVNNVTYNVKSAITPNPCYNNSPASWVEIVNNYLQGSPLSESAGDVLHRVPGIEAIGAGWGGDACRGQSFLYTLGNYHSTNCADAALACQHSWAIGQPGDTVLPTNYTWATSPIGGFPTIATQTDAFTAKTEVLAKAGAYAVAGGWAPVRRDAADARAVASLNTLTPGQYNFSSMADIPGGYPTYAGTTPTAYVDTDGDGMQDSWETAHGLNPNDAADGRAVSANGYTNLENFLNELAGDTIPSGTLPTPSKARMFHMFPQR